MNKKYVLRLNGAYYIAGRGFCATCKQHGTVLTEAQANEVIACGAKFGQSGAVKESLTNSWAVNYIRATDLNSRGEVCPNSKNPSRRRFATKDEAIQHGSRFGTRRASANDAAGSAGHIGFYVTESSDPVNAVINWKTGLTNPL